MGGLNLTVTLIKAVIQDLKAACYSYVSSNYGKIRTVLTAISA